MIDNAIARAAATALGLNPDELDEAAFGDYLNGRAELVFTLDGNDQVRPQIIYPEEQ